MSSNRQLFVVAVAVAFVAGLLGGSRTLLPILLTHTTDISISEMNTAIAAMAIALVIVNPLTMIVVGYLWGQNADVPSAYLGFAGRLFVAGLVGFVVGYLAIVAALPNTEGAVLVRAALMSTTGGIRLAGGVALAGLAASAVAHFRKHASY